MVRKTNKRQPRPRKNKGKSKSRRTRKGGCGCNKSTLIGGSANLDVLPKEYYYSYNTEPNYLNDQMKGGKRKSSRGGIGLIGAAYSIGPALDSQNVNTLLGADANVDSDVTQQPASNAFPDTTIATV
ncbi:MAG: hypothetical protein ACOVRN_13070 [Flavobacterium sp.]